MVDKKYLPIHTGARHTTDLIWLSIVTCWYTVYIELNKSQHCTLIIMIWFVPHSSLYHTHIQPAFFKWILRIWIFVCLISFLGECPIWNWILISWNPIAAQGTILFCSTNVVFFIYLFEIKNDIKFVRC